MRHILLIDDLRSIEVEDADVTVARTAAEGAARIAERPWDVLLLDHDLGDGGDVREIVSRIEEAAFHGTPLPIQRIVVVSNNVVGADWVRRGLGRYYHVEVRPAPLEIPAAWA
jgi:CheY-like chemotaxis protein